jgi:hypothetical protein
MITLLSTLLSFVSGGLPNILAFFQDKSDKKHELELARMQTERELELKKAGYEIQAKIEDIKTEQLTISSEIQSQEIALKEREALYQHDIAIGQGASQWVINARAIVRPAITFGMFALLVFVDVFGFYYALQTGVEFTTAMDSLWDSDTQIIWSSIVAFWFGTQAFSKK